MLPTFFISHGSPLHALDAGEAGEAWQAMAASVAEVRAVLVVTAHWESAKPTFSSTLAPPMIYDFAGFPEALYQIRYPAAGAPWLASRAQQLLIAAGVSATLDNSRGLDHGTWVPMRKMFPQATIPVVQLSVQPHAEALHHVAVGRALAPLADEGVLIIGSGHLTHNLGDWMRGAGQAGVPDYVGEFKAWTERCLTAGDVTTLSRFATLAPQGRRAHPSPEHFLPLIIAFAAAGAGAHVTSRYAGLEANVLAMDAYQFN